MAMVFEAGMGGWNGGPVVQPDGGLALKQRQQLLDAFKQQRAPAAAPFTPNPQLGNNADIPPSAYNGPLTPAPGFVNGGGAQVGPAPMPAPQAPAPGGGGGGGGDLNAIIQELLAGARGTGYVDTINSAYDLQSKQAAEAAGLAGTDDMASRGMLPGDNQSRDLNARLIGQAMSPIAANRAAALADAQNQQQARLGGIANLLDSQQQRQLEQTRLANQDTEDRRRWDAEQGRLTGLDAENRRRWEAEQARLAAEQARLNQPPGQGTTVNTPGGGSATFFQPPTGGTPRQPTGQRPYQAPYVPPVDTGGGASTIDGVLSQLGYAGGAGALGAGVGGISGFNNGQMSDPNFGQRLGGEGGIFRGQGQAQGQAPGANPATSFSGQGGQGSPDSFVRQAPAGGNQASTNANPAAGGVGAPVAGGATQVAGPMGSGYGFAAGPTQGNPLYQPGQHSGAAGYGQSWNQPQTFATATGRDGRSNDLFRAATGRYS